MTLYLILILYHTWFRDNISIISGGPLDEMKWNEKLLMHLNPQCPEFRGAANPNQIHLPFQFVDPACRDTKDLGWKSLAEI